MIDDDTYLLIENMVETLKQLDPNDDYYLGKILAGKCGDKSVDFAHGGSGVILSRAAIKKLVLGFDGCLFKYNKICKWGDARLASCLKDNGVSASFLPNLHGDPPSIKDVSDSFWPGDPCELPLSYHHMLPYQTQKLNHLEELNINIPFTTYGDVFNEFINN